MYGDMSIVVYAPASDVGCEAISIVAATVQLSAPCIRVSMVSVASSSVSVVLPSLGS